MRRFCLLVLGLVIFHLSAAHGAQELKFDCTGKIEHGDVPLAQEPEISGAELKIDLNKQELLLTTLRPLSVVYGKITDVTDVMIRFRTPDGSSFGGIDRTNGEFMVTNMKADTTFWLKCNLRRQLF